MRLPKILLTVAAAALLAPTTTAQCQMAMGTGCPGAMAGMCQTEPIVGTMLEFMGPKCMKAMNNATMVLGTPMAAPVTLGMPVTCGSCVWATNFMAGMQKHMVMLMIPNDATLVGQQFSIQAACNNAMMGCLELAARMDVTVMAAP